ncbi:hypothetical protein GCM10027284_34130 [Cyclobacterium sediminis]
MAWEKCENCNGIGSNYNYSTNQSDICVGCGGTGKIPVADTRGNGGGTLSGGRGGNSGGTTGGGGGNVGNPQQNARYILATIAFFGGGYYVLTHLSENLVIVGIIALILSFIAYKWYKAIIIIAAIVGVYYFIMNDI